MIQCYSPAFRSADLITSLRNSIIAVCDSLFKQPARIPAGVFVWEHAGRNVNHITIDRTEHRNFIPPFTGTPYLIN